MAIISIITCGQILISMQGTGGSAVHRKCLTRKEETVMDLHVHLPHLQRNLVIIHMCSAAGFREAEIMRQMVIQDMAGL